MNIIFVNENTLGHASYLLPFVDELSRRPDLSIHPIRIDATPLPEEWAKRANWSIRGLRRWGLDMGAWRWRRVVSEYVRTQVDEICRNTPIDGIVVNTQSVGLMLSDLADQIPLFVCLDATFAQLARSAWFAPNLLSRLFLPFTLRSLLRHERQFFRGTRMFFPWSPPVADSLEKDYEVPRDRITVIPPSMPQATREAFSRTARVGSTPPTTVGAHKPARLLFIGGDFTRKGGPLLLDCFRQHLRNECELHIVTHSAMNSEPGVFIHHGVSAYSEKWRQLWLESDLFVFPSRLETFGIVLMEALAFGVPVVSSNVGAASYVLDQGRVGWLLPGLDPAIMAQTIQTALANKPERLRRSQLGRERVKGEFSLESNARRMAECIRTNDGEPAVDC